jgi:hypothetical protein
MESSTATFTDQISATPKDGHAFQCSTIDLLSSNSCAPIASHHDSGCNEVVYSNGFPLQDGNALIGAEVHGMGRDM